MLEFHEIFCELAVLETSDPVTNPEIFVIKKYLCVFMLYPEVPTMQLLYNRQIVLLLFINKSNFSFISNFY